jgi:hypothetical protein
MSKSANNGIRTIPFIAWDDTSKLFSIGAEASELISRLTNHHIGKYTNWWGWYFSALLLSNRGGRKE